MARHIFGLHGSKDEVPGLFYAAVLHAQGCSGDLSNFPARSDEGFGGMCPNNISKPKE
jgi:hypothetical protein